MLNDFKSLTLEAFQKRFATTQQCIDHLASIKWTGNSHVNNAEIANIAKARNMVIASVPTVRK